MTNLLMRLKESARKSSCYINECYAKAVFSSVKDRMVMPISQKVWLIL